MSLLPLLLISSSVFLVSVHGLTCYENDDQGNVFERTNANWKYCSLVPFASSNGDGRLNGIGETNENLAGYEATFGQNNRLYKVLSVCLLEKYDFAAVNPALGAAPEFLFRCICNTDKCNKESTFSKFLSSRRA